MSNNNPDSDIQRLMQTLIDSPAPNQEVHQRVYDSTLVAWRALPERQAISTKSQRTWPLSVAAIVALIAVVTQFMPEERAYPVGEIVSSRGEAYLDNELIDFDDPLFTGQSVRTASDSNLSLAMSSGVRVSLDSETQIEAIDSETLKLLAGRVYIDADQGSVRIAANNAVLTDIGTIYDVVVDGRVTRVNMREGKLEIAVGGAIHLVKAERGMGERVVVTNARVVKQSGLPTTSPYWDWHTSEAKSLHNLSVHDYLKHMARTKGYELAYNTELVAQQARLETLVGASQTTADVAFNDVMETTRFRIEQLDGYRWQVNFR